MKSRAFSAGNIGGNLVAWGYALIILGPMAWILSNSFKRQIDILMGTTVAPVTTSNYVNIIASRQSDFLWNLFNSGLVAVISTALVLAIATVSAFTVVRLSAPRWFTFGILGWALIFHMLPTLTFVGSWYVMFSQMGLHGSYLAIILTHTVNNLPLAIFLMMGFLLNIPKELVQAARLDGCNYRQVFIHLVIPLSMGGMAAAGALTFINSWSDFAIALNLSNRDTMTAPVAIATFAQEHQIRYGEMAAASVLSMIPALVFILFGQRFVVRGLLAGAVK
ncbi:carbohydrate ABC transporter permease [Pelagibacterium halotolerans]|uniref:ABC transporter, inner membrane subunit n=1 Tax=Pelagibacterium halotolerans (strain DSM 22347 / JCM 15775 / CGMCC 1.7692 / B2) TaxID=1082931 RepID=G4R7B0_PELHB|nr:carbohydrate ABC transporter permease [Pelagibacterium halotolerans]AEQ51246.1 ABC transporter, inner membrane subunit [Pelagibacterium halotolerans B2]QJR18894.1 carbohydrate ABC transporter permease [Pelagibacterium halotolerans]SEA67418.1 carbohydrate ABC transporter membrane protein 2, CUT1 family [Pelagibacterium halotolerans]